MTAPFTSGVACFQSRGVAAGPAGPALAGPLFGLPIFLYLLFFIILSPMYDHCMSHVYREK